FPYDNNLTTEAIIDEKIGDFQSAMEIAQKAYKANNYNDKAHDEDTYLALSKIFIENYNYIEAQKIIHSGLRDYPRSLYLWVLLAYCDIQTQDKNGANYALDKASSIGKNQALVSLLLNSINKNIPFTLEFN